MKFKKLIILFVLFTLTPALILAQGDREIFDEAKKDLFDKEWQQALVGLDKIITDYPDSRFYTLAYFYKGKCLEELEKPKKAWQCYHTFIDISNNESLKEEATASIINLGFLLYEKGEKRYLEEIKGFLKSKDWLIQTFAAFKLSYAGDKKVAALAVPVLKKIISREQDDVELVDRAKVALMRIDPGYLKGLTKKNREPSTISIRIYDKETGGDSFTINIPFALARLALNAIPAKEKKELKKEGYDIDKILKTLIEGKDVVKIETEDSILSITID